MFKLVEREPLSEQEVIDYLYKSLEAEEKRLGKDNYFFRLAKKHRDEEIAKFRAGEVIEVTDEAYIDTLDDEDCFFTRVLLSNGKIRIYCNGFCN